MILYMNRRDVPNLDRGELPSAVIDYVIGKANKYERRCRALYGRYIGVPQLHRGDEEDDVRAEANYAKYIVDIIRGYFLSEPVKYDCNDRDKKDSQAQLSLVSTVEAKLDRQNGTLVRHNAVDEDKDGLCDLCGKKIDISAVMAAYHSQNIATVDQRNGKAMGIYGESCELLYASTEEQPHPRSAVYAPDQIVLVQDDTVEHKDLFALWFEQRERTDRSRYYAVTVYTATQYQQYESTSLDKENYVYNPVGAPVPHFFDGVPVVCYENNEERQGDFEQVANLIDARNELLSDRLTDKRKFVNSILAAFGAVLPQDTMEAAKRDRLIDGIPQDARLEYIQKTFDENSMKVLDDTLVSDIHKMTLTPDMTDQAFAGNASGVALKLKLLALHLLVKSKMSAMEAGLKKRWRLYNNWLAHNGIDPVSVDDVDIVFTVALPIDEAQIVQMVCTLKNAGLVDDQTLLSLLWFVKDPAEAVENMKQQKQENQQQYMDSFTANTEDKADEKEQSADQEQQDKEKDA